MSCTLAIASIAGSAEVLGTRFSAVQIRERIEQQLESCSTIEIDFGGKFVTQGFVDELFGPLILRMGSTTLERMAFRGCGEQTRAILQLVFTTRLQDFAERQNMRASAQTSSSSADAPAH